MKNIRTLDIYYDLLIPINNPIILSTLINEFKEDYDDEYN